MNCQLAQGGCDGGRRGIVPAVFYGDAAIGKLFEREIFREECHKARCFVELFFNRFMCFSKSLPAGWRLFCFWAFREKEGGEGRKGTGGGLETFFRRFFLFFPE